MSLFVKWIQVKNGIKIVLMKCTNEINLGLKASWYFLKVWYHVIHFYWAQFFFLLLPSAFSGRCIVLFTFFSIIYIAGMNRFSFSLLLWGCLKIKTKYLYVMRRYFYFLLIFCVRNQNMNKHIICLVLLFWLILQQEVILYNISFQFLCFSNFI